MIKKISLAVSLVLFSSCAHNHVKGSVVMIHTRGEADVCLGSNEVKPGDRVSILKSVCTMQTSLRRSADVPRCEKKPVGEGLITQVLNEHYSTMEVKDNVPVEVGFLIEGK